MDLAIAILRGCHVAAVLSLIGTAVTHALITPIAVAQVDGSVRDRVDRHQRALLWLGALAALVSGLAWLIAQSAAMASAASAAETFAAVPLVLTSTVYGHALIARIVLLLLTVATWRVRWLAVVCAVACAVPEAWMGHAGSSGTVALPVSVSLHVALAGAWLGGLVPLALLIRDLPGSGARIATMRFAALGWYYVGAFAVTAFVQAWMLIGSIPGLVGTPYGQVALLKLGLFAVLLGIAAVNRYVLARLVSSRPAPFLRSMAVETGVALIAVFAAAHLSEMAPAEHDQPVWPFAWQLDFSPLADPDLGPEARLGLALIAGSVLALLLAAVWRRARWPAIAAAIACAVFAWPHLDLFAIPAYPTSFDRSPTGFSAESIMRGEAVYAANCVSCHGPASRGDGPLAKTLPIPPADLTAHIWMHPDGELFWWITHGMEDPEGGLAMPGFPQLSDDDVWAAIDFVHANAAGADISGRDTWPNPVPAPGLVATCPNGTTVTNDDLRGTTWRIVAGDGSLTIMPGACVVTDAAAWRAAALVAGVKPDAFAGTQLLVDAGGWLRARALPGTALDVSAAAHALPAMMAMHHH